jgi:hypothetical protein
MAIFFLVVESVVSLLQGSYDVLKIGGVGWCDLIHDDYKTIVCLVSLKGFGDGEAR